MPAKKTARKSARPPKPSPIRITGAPIQIGAATLQSLLILLTAEELKEHLRTRGIGIPKIKNDMVILLTLHLCHPENRRAFILHLDT